MRKKSGLKSLLLGGLMALSPLLPNAAFSQDLPSDPKHPMYGLNQFVPAYTPEITYDFYGSGDANKDEKVNQEDMDYMKTQPISYDPYNDGTYTMDLDLDGDSNDSDDQAILQNYLDGGRTHLNQWELMTNSEKWDYFDAFRRDDPTSEVDYFEANVECGYYSTSTLIGGLGVFQIENSSLTTPNPNSLDIDIERNGRYRLPINEVATWFIGNSTGVTTNEGGHAINAVFIPNDNNPDPKDFYQYAFFEPQTDEVIERGNPSLNNFANLSKTVYLYSEFLGKWLYGSRDLINFNFEGEGVNIDSFDQDLILSWNPLTYTQPEDKTIEYFEGIGIENTLKGLTGEASNVYPGTRLTKLVTTNQEPGEVYGHDNFEAIITWMGEAGAYNSTNSEGAIKTQNISIRDTEKPYFSEQTNSWKDNSCCPLTLTEILKEQKGTDPWEENYYVYPVDSLETMTDVSGNESEERYLSTTTKGELPTGNWNTFPPTYEVSGKDSPMPNPSESGTPTVEVSQEAPYSLTYEDGEEPIRTDALTEVYERVWKFFYATASDTLKRTQEISKNSGVGLEEVRLADISVYPNPTSGNITLDLGLRYIEVRVQIKNSLGQCVKEKVYNSVQTLTVELPQSKGFYFLLVEADGIKNTIRIIKE